MKRLLSAMLLALCCITASAQLLEVTPQPVFRAFDSNGKPLLGGKLFSYIAGTTTPLPTYGNALGTSTNTNPVILDATGQAKVFLGGGTYKLVLQNSAGVEQWTVDNIVGSNVPGATAIIGNPTGTQVITQPPGTTLNVNNFNSVIYAQTGDNIATLCSGFTGTLMITIPVSVTVDSTIPATCSVVVQKGGTIDVAIGKNLTFAGPFTAGLYQTFLIHPENVVGGPGNVYFTGGNSTREIYPQWFGAMGSNTAAGFTASAGTLTITINGRNPFAIGDPVTLTGAGITGTDLVTSITAVTPTTFTVATPTVTAVTTVAAAYTGDDTVPLQVWANSVRGNATNNPTIGYNLKANLGPSKLYVPKGQYVVSCNTSLRIYSGIILEFEASNTTHSARFMQCNYNRPAIRLMPFNLDIAGNVINTSGNMIMKYLDIIGVVGFNNISAAPFIQFDPSPINWSDTEIDHAYFGQSPGSAITGGFATTTTALAAASSITVGDGSDFITGEQIQISGAGVAGAVLTTTINGCGTKLCGNSFNISPVISTSVTNATVKPLNDLMGFKINNSELDVGFRFMTFSNNASGSVWIDNAEIYQAVAGAAVSSGAALALTYTNNKCFGCGSPNGGATQGRSINWVDNTQSKTVDVMISHSQFFPIPSQAAGETAGVNVQYERSLSITNSQWWNVDTDTTYKGILFQGVNQVLIQGNILQAGTIVTGPGNLIETCCAGADASISAQITGNTLQATGAAVAKAINFDVTPTTFNTVGNTIAGNFTVAGNTQSVATTGTTTVGQAACIKVAATTSSPAVIGSCGTIASLASGSCTCN